MDERLEGRDGIMRQGETTNALRLVMGISVALITIATVPLAPGQAACATSTISSPAGVSATVDAPAAEAPSATSLRTAAILAGVAIGMAALVGLWWYLVIRGRSN